VTAVRLPAPAGVRGKIRSEATQLRASLPWRRIAALVAAVLLVLVAYEQLVTTVMYRQRQQHLVSDFTDRRPAITTGDAVAVLQIPSIELDLMVAEGTNREVLRGGPGRVATTPAPGEPGNAVIVGKSSRFGAPFADITKLVAGDTIAVQTRGAGTVQYVVERVAPVAADGGLPLSSQPLRQLTLVTSEGSRLSDRRIAVVATLDVGDGAAPPAADAPVVTGGEAGFIDSHGPSARELGELLVWAASLVAIAFIYRGMRARLTMLSSLVAFAPLVLGAMLKLALASDAIFPLTR
jgi:sortase A